MDEKTLIKFIKNQGDDIFKQSVIDWIRTSIENQKTYYKIKATYVASFEDDLSIDPIKEHTNFKRRVRKNKYLINTAAAVIIFLIATSALFLIPGINNIGAYENIFVTATGEQKEFILNDGSKVQLNSESSLAVSENFNTDERLVKLTGEAFFDVAQNKDKPFIVEIENGLRIKVVGTTFNIKAYKDDPSTQTTLVTGKVELYKNKNTTPIAILEPKQKGVFNKKSETINVLNKVSIKESISWREGILNFDNTSFNEVIRELERWYNVTIKINDVSLEDYSFSGKFMRKNSIEEVLEIIEISSPIKYTYNVKNQTILFTKRSK